MRRMLLLVFVVGCGSDPAPAKLAADIDTVTIPGATVGEPGMTGTVHIANLGKKPSGMLAVTLAGDPVNDFALDAATTCGGATLAADDQCDIVVKFMPSKVGDRPALIHVTASPGGVLDVPLSAAGLGPTIQVQPTLDFHVVEVGQQGIEQVAFTNTGTVLGHIGAFKVVGPNFGRSNTSCNAVILPQGSCTIDIGFVPPAVGMASGSLVVTISGQDYTVALIGLGGGRVTVTKAGAGTGTVTSAPAGIDCGATCTTLATTALVLTEVPATGSTFASWSLAGCTGTTCTVPSSNTAQTITATFQ